QGIVADLSEAQLDAFVADPIGQAPALLGTASTRLVYAIERYATSGAPTFAATLARETHVSDLENGEASRVQLSISYSDGFAREIQNKRRVEPGPLDTADPTSPIVDPRWVGSGWTVYNNKALPVRRYEPFFSAGHDFEFTVQAGVAST